jgi:hypothetical protein
MESKEEFCSACLSIPIALAGGVAAKGSGGTRKKNHMLMIVSIISFFISLFIAMYYLYFKKCKECLDTNIF